MCRVRTAKSGLAGCDPHHVLLVTMVAVAIADVATAGVQTTHQLPGKSPRNWRAQLAQTWSLGSAAPI